MALTGAQCRDLWTRFINAEYLPEREGPCSDCDTHRDCNNHFCLACKEGGLCASKFKTNQPHDHHPWLQVRRITSQNIVNASEVEHFLGANADKIQKFVGNSSKIFNLRTKPGTKNTSADVICRGCDKPITKSKSGSDGVEVCSIECLIIHAERKQKLDEYLQLKEGVDVHGQGFELPLTVQQKLRKHKACAPAPMSERSAPMSELGAPMSEDKDDSGGSELAGDQAKLKLGLAVKAQRPRRAGKKKTTAAHGRSAVDPSQGSSDGSSEMQDHDYSAFALGHRSKGLDLLRETWWT